MDEQRFGSAIRALRVRARKTQQQVADAAGVSRGTYARVERGHARTATLDKVQRIAAALDARAELDLRWRAGQLDRLLDARHAALQQEVVRRLGSAPGWVAIPEATFSVYGERGSIDVLGWHGARRALLVVEIKSAIVDLQALLRAMDQRRRLGAAVARERGWRPVTVSSWLAVEATDANRRRVRRHGSLLGAVFESDGATLRRWLRDPGPSLHVLSFVSIEHLGTRTQPLGAPERVRSCRRAGIRAAPGATVPLVAPARDANGP